jgi:hypothetical protein
MQKFLSSLTYAGLLLLSCIVSNNTYADKTKDNYFTVGSLSITPVFITNDAAFSLLVEAGSKSDRVNGTIGFIGDQCNRFKLSAEYLSQDLHYKFITGKVRRWMHQFAFGGKYQYIYDCPTSCIRGLELGFAYSNAPNKSLSPKHFDLTAHEGGDGGQLGDPVEAGTLFRKIAGAWSWDVEAGFLLCPWKCASLIPSIVYQQVTYSRHYESKKRVSGVGFNLAFNQRLFRNIDFDLKYQFRQAYNDLRVSLNWQKVYRCGALGLGIFVDHVYGKRELCSSTTTGFEISFAFGVCGCEMSKVTLLPDCGEDCNCNPCNCGYEDLLAWVTDPAVYMPEVLAIVDQQECFTPSDHFPMDGINLNTPPFFQDVDLDDYFNPYDNSEIHYEDVDITTVYGDATATYNPEDKSIDLELTGSGSEFHVELDACNECGCEHATFDIIISGV